MTWQERAIELIQQGEGRIGIAEILKQEDLKTRNGTYPSISSIQQLKDKLKKKRGPRVIDIPIAAAAAKITAIVGDPQAIAQFLKEYAA